VAIQGAAKDRVVTLAGVAQSFRQRRRAVAAVERVIGVVGIVDDIEVRLPVLHWRPDPEIARNIVEALRLELPEAVENLKFTVDDGFVVIEGELGSDAERKEAELAIRLQPSVRDIRNFIRLKPRPLPARSSDGLRSARTERPDRRAPGRGGGEGLRGHATRHHPVVCRAEGGGTDRLGAGGDHSRPERHSRRKLTDHMVSGGKPRRTPFCRERIVLSSARGLYRRVH
jgi:hypothetical protein